MLALEPGPRVDPLFALFMPHDKNEQMFRGSEVEKVMDFMFQEKSPETFPGNVECATCPPEQGGMEQAVPGGGAPPLPSGAPAAEPGIPQCLCNRTALETISQAQPLVFSLSGHC